MSLGHSIEEKYILLNDTDELQLIHKHNVPYGDAMFCFRFKSYHPTNIGFTVNKDQLREIKKFIDGVLENDR